MLRFLVELALLLDVLDFAASQCQRFKHTLVFKLRLGIWLLSGTPDEWALVLARRLVHLSHRNPHILWLVSPLQLAPKLHRITQCTTHQKTIANLVRLGQMLPHS